MPAMLMLHETDPADDIRKAIGDLSGVNIMNNQILIGIYIPPEKTASNILLTKQTRDESLYQGKVGLVLKKGPQAFVDRSNASFDGQDVEVGEWVVYRVSEGWQLKINTIACRLIEDAHVKLVVTHPDIAW